MVLSDDISPTAASVVLTQDVLGSLLTRAWRPSSTSHPTSTLSTVMAASGQSVVADGAVAASSGDGAGSLGCGEEDEQDDDDGDDDKSGGTKGLTDKQMNLLLKSYAGVTDYSFDTGSGDYTPPSTTRPTPNGEKVECYFYLEKGKDVDVQITGDSLIHELQALNSGKLVEPTSCRFSFVADATQGDTC